MTTELIQILIAIGILTLTTLILTPILLWAFGYSWNGQHCPSRAVYRMTLFPRVSAH